MIKYATRLPPGKPVELLDNGLIRKTVISYTPALTGFMQALLEHLIKNPDPLVVPVYDFKLLSSDSYYYDMMRCGILSQEERTLINKVGDLWDRYGREACHQDDLDLQLKAKAHPELFKFLTTVTEQNRYHDLHSGNVMMSEDYNYCLVDLEGFVRIPLEQPTNNWITKEK